MEHKYLSDAGVPDDEIICNISQGDAREARWKQQQKIYGFDERETWALNTAFFQWLYERLLMYKEIGGERIDLTYHKCTYKEKIYTQLELINALVDKLKLLIIDDDFNEDLDVMKDICEIWGILLPYMWW